MQLAGFLGERETLLEYFFSISPFQKYLEIIHLAKRPVGKKYVVKILGALGEANTGRSHSFTATFFSFMTVSLSS